MSLMQGTTLGVEIEPNLHSNEINSAYELGNAELPIARHRLEIDRAIRNSSVLILVAPTGSGKSTQVPQYAHEMGIFDEITVTQPRIVAARTISERVQNEMTNSGRERRSKVGYYTGRERSEDPQYTQDIAVLTDGTAALQMLHNNDRRCSESKRLLIIDEAHEWNLNIELLLALAAEKTDPNSPKFDPLLKVVIMSATMDSESLQNYFKSAKPAFVRVDVPTYEVERSMTSDSVANVALGLVMSSKAKVLVFEPGKREINDLANKINKRNSNIPVVSLHGQQKPRDQRRAFDEFLQGGIVATTNVAETSVTVPDAYAVVDSGLVRIDEIDYGIVPTGSKRLRLEHTAQANLMQRMGRVGRTGPGVYVLASQDGNSQPLSFAERAEYSTPAMDRTRLDSLMLSLKAAGCEIEEMKFPHTPPEIAVNAARQRLFTLGAIDSDGAITSRGLVMSTLPLDTEYSCMVAFAHEKGYAASVQKSVADIAVIMQLGGIFSHSPAEQRWRELLALDVDGDVRETESDFFAQLEAYTELTSYVDRRDWSKYDINEYALELVEQNREILAQRLNAPLGHTSAVLHEDRKAVLTCINAGQLNQIWQRSGDGWSLFLGGGEVVEQSRKSVLRLGQLATGSLFSLGRSPDSDDSKVSVQDMNRVEGLGSLVQAASHLVNDVMVHDSAVYDSERTSFLVTIHRKIGDLTIATVQRRITEIPEGQEGEAFHRICRENLWKNWIDQQPPVVEYTSHHSMHANIEEPESIEFAVDPFTGEPLVAYRNGRGRWSLNKDDAIKSLEARRKHLINFPDRIEAKRRRLEKRPTSVKKLEISSNTGNNSFVKGRNLRKRK